MRLVYGDLKGNAQLGQYRPKSSFSFSNGFDEASSRSMT
jgi:hypothetical protein